jgi:hypothetical protein
MDNCSCSHDKCKTDTQRAELSRRALAADSKQTLACMFLSVALLEGVEVLREGELCEC